MRTAEDRILDLYGNHDFYTSDGWRTTFTYEGIKFAINEARKEAIEECAERARYVKLPDGNFTYLKENSKESILSLIKELK